MASRMPAHVTLEDLWMLMQSQIDEQREWQRKIDKSFPKNRHGEPDYDGHGEYHTKLIDRAVKLEGVRERVIERVLGGSVWATIIFVVGAVGASAVNYLKDHIK